MKSRKAERLPKLGSREEIEGGVKPFPALRAPVMTAAIIVNLLVLLAHSVPRLLHFCACRTARSVVHCSWKRHIITASPWFGTYACYRKPAQSPDRLGEEPTP